MKSYKVPLAAALLATTLTVIACGGSISTANVASASLSADSSGSPATTTFTPDQQTFYYVVQLANAPDDTKLKAVWTAVQAEGAEPNLLIDQTEITSGDGTVTFKLANDGPWPIGSYKVELYLNDKLDRTLEFKVE